MLTSLAAIGAVLALLGVFFATIKRRRLLPGTTIPDGPPRRPLVGNLLDIPPKHSWLQFHEWQKQYGPLYRLDLAGRTNIIVNTEGIANDLLRERGNTYSSREQLPMGAQLLSDNLRPVLLPYGDTWRQVRKLMHNVTNVGLVANYEPVQEDESTRMVWDLVREPASYEKWFLRYSAGLIMRIAYSKPVHTGEESYLRRIQAVNDNLERIVSPGSYLVDTFPGLMILPDILAPFKQEGKRLHAEELDLFRTLLREGIQASSNDGQVNFCGVWHSSKESYNLSEDHVAYAIGTLFEAGAGTTSAAMGSFLLAVTLHPKELQKLQQEIDDVVGSQRLPKLSDMPNLPRVRAVAKETLRWRPVTAGGLPHQSTKDDTYTLPSGEKVFLEAGANIHPVQWSIHREVKRYPDPDSFRPERWLEQSWPTYKEPLTTYPNMQNFSSFGFGRRICPGQHIAERSLYIEIAKIAWACDISQKLDAAGQPIAPPLYDYVAGFNVSRTSEMPDIC
jgi:cytochrome P450